MSTLRDRFDPRRNSFDLLRLLFALLVAADHGVSIRTGHHARWGQSTLGDFGLDGFFILSGFLVTRSWVTLESFSRFVWHRFLRIMPGFWVCLLVTALVVAPLAAVAQGMSLTAPFTGDPSALRYLFGNSALLIVQYDIAGILADTPQGVSFNGALWTLFFESFCYVIVAGLGVVGVLRRQRVVVLLVLGMLAILTILQEAGLPVLINDRILRLTFVFLLGAAAYLFAERLPMRTGLAVASAGIFLLSVNAFEDYRVLGAAPLAYLLVWFGTCVRWPWPIRADLSYGMYIYHWPTMQLLVLTGVGTTAVPLFLLIGLGTTTTAALQSWFLIERPSLRRKHSAFPDRVAAAVARAGGSR
ncbi:MAG: acyltransferase [Pseudonocardia sp.]|nr:acyltransferase [Pseudonocardia sp.]